MSLDDTRGGLDDLFLRDRYNRYRRIRNEVERWNLSVSASTRSNYFIRRGMNSKLEFSSLHGDNFVNQFNFASLLIDTIFSLNAH